MRIVIYGTGKGASGLLEEIRNDKLRFKDETVGIIDSKSKKWGEYFEGMVIYSPAQISEINFDYIIIASVYLQEITKDLIEKYGVSKENILSKAEYLRATYAKKQYSLYYKRASSQMRKYKENKFLGKMIVYTAILGKYDELKEPTFISDSIDYVCFTDNREIRSKHWNIKYVSLENETNLPLAVRRFKFFPHKYFPDNEISVWVDGKFAIQDDLREYIKAYLGESHILFFPHPERNCIYKEGEECIRSGKGNPQDIRMQLDYYKKLGYPAENGLIEGGCIVRRHREQDVQNIMELWWREINKYSQRDQLSIPYLCWKEGFRYDLSDLDINKNKYLQVYAHKLV